MTVNPLARFWCRLRRLGQRGGVAVIFAVAAMPITIGTVTAVDFGRIAAGRAALQRAVDNAALSGASAYVLYTQGDTFNAVAQTVATAAYCNATTALPAGFTLTATSGGRVCAGMPGPAVSAVIGGYTAGTRGMVAGSGCTATKTVVSGANCGFVVTVTASATMRTMLPFVAGSSRTLTVTASAANPFLNLGAAITPTLLGSATYANSLWIYPLLLDANGNPDFVTNPGALPDTSACTGAPTQTTCGVYTMLASTKYSSCTSSAPCTINGTVFGGAGGIVQNPSASSTVITATTPLGIAFESSAGGASSYGYNQYVSPPDGCAWATTVVYNLVTQVYDAANTPLLVDGNGHWQLSTRWFYSSYLANNYPPSQSALAMQTNTQINPATGRAYNSEDNPPVPKVVNGVNTPATCPNATAPANQQYVTTTYPTVGTTNCSLYIMKDPKSLRPNPTYKTTYGKTGTCFTPAGTPGRQYAALSCQSFAGHNFVFFWNDMGGRVFDDTDYGNGVLQIGCAGPAHVVLIN